MATLKKTLVLESTDHNGLGYGDADWQIDDNGNLQVVEGIEAVGLNVVKMVHTHLTSWGYGTILNRLLGTKNIAMLKGASLYSVKKGITFLAWIRDRHMAIQTFQDTERLKGDLSVELEPNEGDNSTIILRCKIETVSGDTLELATAVTGTS